MLKRAQLLLLVFLCVMELPLFAMKSGEFHNAWCSADYSIYFFSEEGADMDAIYGSYLNIRQKAGIGMIYDYYIKPGQHVEGHIEQYTALEREQRYVLEHFFDGKANALLRILDMPNCDNMKVAVIQYANEKEDAQGTFWQYILVEREGVLPPHK